MKLSIETYGMLVNFPVREGLERIKAAGFDAVDFSLYDLGDTPAVPGTDFLSGDYEKRAREIRAILDEIGLECNQAHAPFVFTCEDAIGLGNQKWEDVLHAIRFASILGAPHIVVHNIRVPEGADSQSWRDFNLRYYRSFEPYCAEYGIRIAVENLTKAGCTTPELLKDAMKMLDSGNFVALLDVGHSHLRGIPPQDFIRSMGPKALGGLHIQDNHGEWDEHLLPYLGTIDWTEVMRALRETEYAGDFTLETVRFLRPYLPYAADEVLKFAHAVGRSIMEKF